jgi:hypothetical protein
MSGLAKTRRRVVDVSGNFAGILSDRSDQFMKFLVTNSEDAFTRPWHRLERGMRLNRLRRFVDEEAQRFHLVEDEKNELFTMLTKSLDKKQLNSKSIVNYDPEQQKILEIKGLNYHRNAEGRILFQINEKKAGTMRRRPSSAQPQLQAQSQEPKPSTQTISQE